MSRSPLPVILVVAALCAVPDAVGAAQPQARPAQGGKPAKPAKPAGGIYKWVDDKGVTHYGQSIPPEYRDNAATEMNRRGLTVREIDAAAKPEDPQTLEEKARRDKEEKKRLHEQRRRDLALINTYNSAKEIDDARDRSLVFPMQALGNLEPRRRKAQERLTNLEAQRTALVKANKPVPDHLEEEVGEAKLEADALRTEMDQHTAQIAAIRTRFEADRKRFLELTEARALKP